MFDYLHAVKSYIDNCKADCKSPPTIDYYNRVLQKYRAFCSESGHDPASVQGVSGYKLHLSAQGVKLSTVAAYLLILSGFFSYCVTLGLCASDPVAPSLLPARDRIRAERKPYEHLMQENEIDAIFTAEAKPKHAKACLLERTRAMVYVLAGSGLRNSELRSLRPCDLVFGSDADACIIVRSGKGGKYRRSQFPSVVQEAVKKYLESGQRPEGLTDQDLLFGVGKTAADWHEIRRDNLSEIINNFVRAETGHDGVRTHALRHAFASQLLSSGVKMQEIQALLGHSSIITTERYAELLAPQAPVATGNSVFNAKYCKTQENMG